MVVVGREDAPVFLLDGGRVAEVHVEPVVADDDLIVHVPGLALVVAESGADAERLSSVAIGAENTTAVQLDEVAGVTPDWAFLQAAPGPAVVGGVGLIHMVVIAAGTHHGEQPAIGKTKQGRFAEAGLAVGIVRDSRGSDP